MRTVKQSLNNGPLSCPGAGTPGTGIDASVGLCTNPNVSSSSRLAVRIACHLGGGCPPSSAPAAADVSADVPGGVSGNVVVQVP